MGSPVEMTKKADGRADTGAAPSQAVVAGAQRAAKVRYPALRVGEVARHEVRVTEARTADYVNGGQYVVPVGAMVDVDALEEEIATSRSYCPAALAADADHAAQAALAPHLAWNEISVPVETALRLDAPAPIDSRLTLELRVSTAAAGEVAFDFTVTDAAGHTVGTGHHVRRVCEARAMQRALAAARDAGRREQ